MLVQQTITYKNLFRSVPWSKSADFSVLPESIRTEISTSRFMNTPFSCANLVWDYPFEEEETVVVLTIDKVKLRISKSDINKFFFCLQIYRSSSKKTFFDLYSEYRLNFPAGVKFDLFPKKAEDSGQAKILVSTLEAVIDHSPEINMIVVGSASDSYVVGGRTYDSLARILTPLGYHGEFDLYDPLEVSEVQQVGNFKINKIPLAVTNFHDMVMRSGKKPTIIMDDAYDLNYGSHVHVEPTLIDSSYTSLTPGSWKYTLSYNSVKKRYYMDFGLKEHRDVADVNMRRVGRWDVLGGGHYFFDPHKNTISLFGTSERYGRAPLDRVYGGLLRMPDAPCCKFYENDTFRNHDPSQTILTNECRVSIKALELHSSVHELRDQYYYTKREKRCVKNFPPIPHVGVQIGDGCVACAHLGKVIHGVKSYTNATVYDCIKLVVSGHVSRSCYKETGTSQAQKVTRIREYANKHYLLDVAWQDYKLRWPKSRYYDFLRIIRFAQVILEKRVASPENAEVVKFVHDGGTKHFDGLRWRYYFGKKEIFIYENLLRMKTSTYTVNPNGVTHADTVFSKIIKERGGPFLTGRRVYCHEIGRGHFFLQEKTFESDKNSKPAFPLTQYDGYLVNKNAAKYISDLWESKWDNGRFIYFEPKLGFDTPFYDGGNETLGGQFAFPDY